MVGWKELKDLVKEIEQEAMNCGSEYLLELVFKLNEMLDEIATVNFEGKVRRDDIDGIEVNLPIKHERLVDFEAIGLAGEYDPDTDKIVPYDIFIGKAVDVRKWLNTFGGCDIIEYVRYDKYANLVKRVRRLEKRVRELEFELAGKEKPVT